MASQSPQPQSSKMTARQMKAKLLNERKLVLFVDLDMTIVKTYKKTHHDEDEFGYYIYPRPYYERFFMKLSQLFELYLTTAASYKYSVKIMKELDPGGTYFGNRIYSTDSVPRGMNKTYLYRLIPNIIKDFVCVIDDTTIKWSNESNVIAVKPYSQIGQDTMVFNSKLVYYLDALQYNLKIIHQKFYEAFDSNRDLLPSVGNLLAIQRKDVLKGVKFFINDLKIRELIVPNMGFAYALKRMGAEIRLDMSSEITHCICNYKNFINILKVKYPEAKCVHSDWAFACIFSFKLCPEDEYVPTSELNNKTVGKFIFC